ncbi:DUF433 domain-containing protein [Anabaena azotica]|uniref:DUF433 domain-containing protein n=1 Tax=Anabaena azotica TaxID=197653 RepID=UPI0039A77576
MQLEDYFNFLAANDIRLKGTRIGIETILYEYIYRARTPEEISQTYTSLSLEQVYATILYYLHNQEAITKYLADWLEWGQQQRKLQAINPPPVAARLQQLRDTLEGQKKVHDAQVSHG